MNNEKPFDLLMKFLKWMDKVSREEPMRLETDNDDIVEMFLDDKE